uniref:Uncharacterized protein n=1 Tax=Phage sp. ctqZP6 TaxID=2828010 RepID=A0A8S5SII9_9VIRU|nr:MAG TPA: hypothetical protein [Phage sp. ctqZP6]
MSSQKFSNFPKNFLKKVLKSSLLFVSDVI